MIDTTGPDGPESGPRGTRVVGVSRRALFEPQVEADARILLLIDGFSSDVSALEGRVKLAKLDFLLRYPAYFARAVRARSVTKKAVVAASEAEAEGRNIETRMVRFRYGPWDPAYFGILGRLVGKGLVEVVVLKGTLAYRTTHEGRTATSALIQAPEWEKVAMRVDVLKQFFDLTGSTLMKFIYRHFPEVQQTAMGQEL